MNPNSLKWRWPLIIVVLGVALLYAVPPFDMTWGGVKHEGKIKLGLDLRGGMHLILRVDTSKLPENAKYDAVARAIEIVRNRIDQFGVAEPSIQAEGIDRIVIQLPGVTDRQRALDMVGKTALLEFKLVSDNAEKLKDASAGKTVEGAKLYKDEEGRDLLLEDTTLLTGKYITNAKVDFGQYGEPVVDLEFNGDGAKLFSDVTGNNVQRRLAIVLDDKVQSAPVINERIPSGRAQISGHFNADQASDLAITLRAGALPAPIVIENDATVGPSLGKDSVQQGIRATLIGLGAVVLFMAVYYLFSGLVANFALLLNVIIILAAMSYFHGTLSLPGIAGIVLTIGMAVDANVLIFERIREEQALKKPVLASLQAGYHKAFATILDSNITTLITALILYFMGSGPIRGFALTLSIGLMASMFTGVFVTRAIFDLMMAKGALKEFKMLHFLQKPPKLDYLKVRRFCYAASIGIIVWGMIVFVQRGEKMFGVDFAGGTMQEYRFEKPIEVEDIRKSLNEVGLGTASIQKIGNSNQIIVRGPINAGEKIEAQIKKDFSGNRFDLLRSENVGPIVGKEMRGKAIWAIVLGLLGIYIYVVWRFDFKFAFGAILSLFHDALITVACVALAGREFSVPVLAAVLTVLGYSINDTIVIFDRIRERRRMGFKETFEQTINNSINLTMARTILTTLTVILVVSSLYFFGGEVINDFAFTMLVGVITGTYSTVYIAAPVLMDWPGSKPK